MAPPATDGLDRSVTPSSTRSSFQELRPGNQVTSATNKHSSSLLPPVLAITDNFSMNNVNLQTSNDLQDTETSAQTSPTSNEVDSSATSYSTMPTSTSNGSYKSLSSSVASNGSFRLMDLPPELRNNIYQYYFSGIKRRYESSKSLSKLKKYFGVLHSTRQVRRETIGLFYKEYMCKKAGPQLAYYRLEHNDGAKMIKRLKALTKSLVENDVSIKITLKFDKDSKHLSLTMNFVDVLWKRLSSGPRTSKQRPMDDYDDFMLNLSDQPHRSSSGFYQTINNYRYKWGGTQKRVGRQSGRTESVEVDYAYTWLDRRRWLDSGKRRQLYYSESFSLTGPLAELDWSGFEYDWSLRDPWDSGPS